MQPTRSRDRSHERPITIWLPVDLVKLLDEKVSSEQGLAQQAVPSARVSRHAVIQAAVRQILERQ